MQITETLANGLKREYSVTIPANELAEQVLAKTEQVGKSVKIPGFRPGKVPAKVVEQRYGKGIEEEVVQDAQEKAAKQVVSDKKLRSAMPPKVEVDGAYEHGKDLKLKVMLDVMPEIPAFDLSGVALKKLAVDVPEGEIQEGINRLVKRQRELKDVDRAVKHGDVVTIDFEGSVDGALFDGGTAKGYSVEIGAGQLIPGFEEQITGMKKGEERTIDVSFPEDYHAKELAGKPSKFQINLHEVKEESLPAIDDEFAKKVGFDDLAKLKDAVRGQLSKDMDGTIRNHLKKQLFDVLDDALKFEAPSSMVELEFGSIWEKLQQAKAQNDPSVAGKSDDALKEEYTRIAERRVRLGLFLNDLGVKQQIKVTNEDLRQAVMDQARMFPGMEQRILEMYKKNPGYVEDLRSPIFEDKVVDYVLTQVKLDESKVSSEELYTIVEGDSGEPKPEKNARKG